MSLKPSNLEEFAQSLRLASDSQLADFDGQILDLLDCEELAQHYSDLLADLEEKAEKKYPTNEPWRWAEFVEALLSEKDQRRDKLRERALRVNAANLPPALEYDL